MLMAWLIDKEYGVVYLFITVEPTMTSCSDAVQE